ncbi:hypothetical protein B0O99DRAFT_670457 [Bisporella sp. PMI_857]|nr:hypothetical protein B0O99DRAFT_670457 [Bisporella sp. PMI_857]
MLSRRRHTKSRGGCKECKRSHIKCDENKPQCSYCAARHLECKYPAKGELIWPGESRSRRSSSFEQQPSSAYETQSGRTSDSTIEDQITRRRAHRKTRNGCTTCKARKIKCDEKKPQCTKCLVYGTDCKYNAGSPAGGAGPAKDKIQSQQEPTPPALQYGGSSPSTQLISASAFAAHGKDATAPPQLPSEDLALMINWFTATIHTVTYDDPSLQSAQTFISRQAMTHDFLMHGVLALSAMHLADQNTGAAQNRYLTAALSHHNAGLAIFTRELGDISVNSYSACLGFSSLTLMFSLASSRPPQHGRLRTVDNLHQIFHLAAGWHKIVGVAQPFLRKNNGGPGKITTGREAPASEETRGAVGSLERLNEEFSKADAAHETEVFAEAIAALGPVFAASEEQPRNAHVVGEWLGRLSERFITLLSEHRTLAIIIAGHYCVILHRYSHVWWLKDWGTGMMRDIWDHVDPVYRESLAWARKAVGLGDCDEN